MANQQLEKNDKEWLSEIKNLMDGFAIEKSRLNQQLAEKDKEFELFKKNTAFREQLSIENRDKRESEIEVLKEALRKAQVILRNENTQKYYTQTLDEEIEQLLK